MFDIICGSFFMFGMFLTSVSTPVVLPLIGLTLIRRYYK